MITIKIENAREIVANERGRLVSKLAPFFVNLERKVEQEIVNELKRVFEEKKVKARINIIDDLPEESTT